MEVVELDESSPGLESPSVSDSDRCSTMATPTPTPVKFSKEDLKEIADAFMHDLRTHSSPN